MKKKESIGTVQKVFIALLSIATIVFISIYTYIALNDSSINRAMKEEDILMQKVGKHNPFTVPEGYFENLTNQVMRELPEKPVAEYKTKPVTLWDKAKPSVYLAAMFVGAAIIIKVLGYMHDNDPAVIQAENDEYETEMVQNMVESMQMDDYSLYLYLSNAE
jgi:hypothetical protein